MQGPVCYGVLAVLVSSVYARVFLNAREACRNGLYGFNPFLIGLALPIFVLKHGKPWAPDFRLIMMMLSLPCLSTTIQAALNKHM
jgi:urea transporter